MTHNHDVINFYFNVYTDIEIRIWWLITNKLSLSRQCKFLIHKKKIVLKNILAILPQFCLPELIWLHCHLSSHPFCSIFCKNYSRTILISSYEVPFDFFWLYVWFFDFIESFVFVWCQTWCVRSYEPHERKVTRTYTPSFFRIRTFIWIKTGLVKI